MISIRNLTKEYNKNNMPLKDVTVTINDGDVIAVIGPSGTGKSTLLRCIDFLEMPSSGEIIVDGETINPADKKALSRLHKKIGMVFQSFNLFNNLTVIENVMVPQVELLGRTRQEAYDHGIPILQEMGMAGYALSYPSELSGGQKQRAAIARTLAMDPEVILMDEPTSALDPTCVQEVSMVIEKIAKSGKTMMIVTHEMEFARNISNRVFYLDEGGIYEDGTPEEIFEHPRRERTRRFIRRIKMLQLSMSAKTPDYYSNITKIEKFSYRYNIPVKRMYHIIHAFEEISQELLQPSRKVTKINFTVEIEPEREEIQMSACYDGGFNLLAGADELRLAILKLSAFDFAYEGFEPDENQNTDMLKMLIK